MRENVQYHVVTDLITSYNGKEPLQQYLKARFRENKQFGSRDRRFYQEIIFAYYRCLPLWPSRSFNESLLLSRFLTTDAITPFAQYLITLVSDLPDVSSEWEKPLPEKVAFLSTHALASWVHYFPFQHVISEPVEQDAFFMHHLMQPGFFIRLNKERMGHSLEILKQKHIPFTQNGSCISLQASTDMAGILPESYYEVQDIASQQTIQLFALHGNERVWDCCSGAGGKSLMLLNEYPDIELYCSDKRQSILDNLQARAKKYVSKPEAVQCLNLETTDNKLHFNGRLLTPEFFDTIVCDVPCSGSGTWSRSPEHLTFARTLDLDAFAARQEAIVKRVLPYLKTGGSLVYITCSVYKSENEAVVEKLKTFGITLTGMEYFKGYTMGGDTLFGAVFRK